MARKAEQTYTNDEELLQLAIKAAKSGQKDGARVMLRQVYTSNRRNETALLWLAKIARNDKERRDWLNKLVELNPDHQLARKALKNMEYQTEASDNRTLLLFGAVAVVMLLLVVAIIAIVVL
ncbi:MAG: hypothetical protein OHK0046_09440 [Anaerolineae bacterium]